MSAGLAASTVTPGRIAPDVSRTVPVIVACASARAGVPRRRARATHHCLRIIKRLRGNPGIRRTQPVLLSLDSKAGLTPVGREAAIVEPLRALVMSVWLNYVNHAESYEDQR